MSYPLHKLNQPMPSRAVCSEIGFWGLDLAGGAFKKPISKAVDTQNLFWSGDALKRRAGYYKIAGYESQIHGIYAWEDLQVIHTGKKLYMIKKDGDYPKLLFSDMNDAPSVGIVRKQRVVHRWCTSSEMHGWRREELMGNFLFINDGKNYLFFDGEEAHPIADLRWGENLRAELEEGMIYSTYATIPICLAGQTPKGTGGEVDPRGENRLSQFRCESFYVDSKSEHTEFILNSPYERCNEGIPTEMQIRDSNGIWRNYCCISKDFYNSTADGRTKLSIDTPIQGGMEFSYDSEGLIVNLGYGVSRVANDGLDNVRITYAVYKDAPAALTGATVQGLYGADGNDNVLFLGGSAAEPGTDAFSARDDFFCFYATSVERLGNEQVAVTGYCRLGDGRLAVLKNDPNTSNVYFRSHTIVSVGETQSGETFYVDAFPSKAGAAVEGCQTPLSVGIAGNEPIFLAASGLYGVRSVSNELTNLDETVRRSIPVDPLLSVQDPKCVRSIVWNGCYLIVFGREALITDGRRDGNGMLRFLKWRFGHNITALSKNGSQLYLGDDTGNIYGFGDSTTDGGREMVAYWHACLPEDGGGRRQILKQISAAISPAYQGELSVEMFQEKTPVPKVHMELNRLDFEAVDFSNFSFDGTDAMRWLDLPVLIGVADRYEIKIHLLAGEDLLFWGLRMVYEKGGTVR